MCCLGRYKGVILLLGTSLLWSHFISPFSLHRSLYLISYSGVWLPQTGRTPFIFIWKTHLVLDGWQRMGAESRRLWCRRDWGKFLYHVNVLQPFFFFFFFTASDYLSPNFFCSLSSIAAASSDVIKSSDKRFQISFASIQWKWYSWIRFETADHWKGVPFIREPT